MQNYKKQYAVFFLKTEVGKIFQAGQFTITRMSPGNEWIKITLPLLDSHNDNVELYALFHFDAADAEIVSVDLSDDGAFSDRKIDRSILANFQVCAENHELLKKSIPPDLFVRSMFEFAQCLLAVSFHDRTIDIYQANLEEAWTALRLIRETVETLGPPGCIQSEEQLPDPTFTAEAEELVKGIRKIAGEPKAEAGPPTDEPDHAVPPATCPRCGKALPPDCDECGCEE